MALINNKSEYDKIREESDRLAEIFRKKEEQDKEKAKEEVSKKTKEEKI